MLTQTPSDSEMAFLLRDLIQTSRRRFIVLCTFFQKEKNIVYKIPLENSLPKLEVHIGQNFQAAGACNLHVLGKLEQTM